MKPFSPPGFQLRMAVMAALALVLVLAFTPHAMSDDTPTPSQLTAVWWQWILGTPVSENPAFDETGANAFVNQPFADQGLIFLCGSFISSNAKREISVPAGTAFFFPVVNFENDNLFYDKPVSVRQLRADAAAGIDSTYDRHATLNGEDLTQVRLTSPVFAYTLPDEDNIYQFFGLDITGTIAPAVSDGYWCYIPPLSRGNYRLIFGATIPNATPAQPPFTFKITYTIRVR
jgi:hypothetical protein